MLHLTPTEKEKILSRLFWDVDVDLVNAESLIEVHLENIEDVSSQQFFRRLLTSCDWYTFLKLVPAEQLPIILDDTVINGLFPRELKTKYKYAREILSR